MQWSRVKNILIVLLVAVNLFLILFYGITNWRENQDKEQTETDFLAAAQALGVTIDRELLHSGVQKLSPAYVYEDKSVDAEIANAILGTCTESVGEDGSTVYESGRGRLRLQNGGGMELTLSLEDGFETWERVEEEILQILTLLRLSHTEIKRLDAEVGQVFLAETPLSVSGMPVFNANLTFEFYSDAIAVYGKRTLHRPGEIQTEDSQELTGLLLSLMGYWKDRGISEQTVTGIELGYLTETKKGERLNMLPVWHVAVENGDWYINALDGSVTSPE